MALTIGRSDKNDLQLLDPKVSRFHCRVEQTNHGIIINDLHSKNGSYINGIKFKSAALSKGDILKIGDNIFSLTPPETKQSPFVDKTMEFEILPWFTPEEEQTKQHQVKGQERLFSSLSIPSKIGKPFFSSVPAQYYRFGIFFQKKSFLLLASFLPVITLLFFLYSFTYEKEQQDNDQETPPPQTISSDSSTSHAKPTPSREDQELAIRIAREARTILETGDFAHAISLFDKALAYDAKNILAQEGLTEAHTYVESLAEICFSRGQQGVQAFNYRDALTEFETVILLLKDLPNHKLYREANKLLSEVKLRIKQ